MRLGPSRIVSVFAVLMLLLSSVPPFRVPVAPTSPAPDEASGVLPSVPIVFPSASTAQAASHAVGQAFGHLPLCFVENRGQLDERVAYTIEGSDKTIYFTPDGVTFALTERPPRATEGEGRRIALRDEWRLQSEIQRWTVKLDFVGANPNVRPIGQDKTDAVISYFKGPQDQWHTGLPTYNRIIYPDWWPGIDLVYYGTVNQLKYEFVVHPGADPAQIQLAYRGAEVSLNATGQLLVTTPLGGFTDDTPVAYQEIDGQRVNVPIAYDLPESHVLSEAKDQLSGRWGFHVRDYDPTHPLILDPAVLVYCGYIGGSGDDRAWSIAVDSAGNAYVTGRTTSTEASFPVTVGPDLTHNGSNDAFVVKVNPAGTALAYAGYIGGSGDEYGNGIAVDGAGNAYITGRTTSSETSFPVTGGPDLIYNGQVDAFVAKVNAAGTALLYAGYLGGSGSDYGYGIAVDTEGNAFVAGYTNSTEASFPVTVGPDLTYNGSNDAFVAKVNATGAALVYAGYIGGSSSDYGWDVAVDSVGNAYVTGATSSTEATFPVTGGPDLTYNGDIADAFVAKVNPAGTALVYAGYLGGSGYEEGFGIAVDSAGNAYITGDTTSTETTFPVTVGPDLTFNGGTCYGPPDPCTDVFVAKVNAAGTALIYCGYIGGVSDDDGGGIAADSNGNAYVTGWTNSTQATFPVTGGPDLTYNGGPGDAFVAKVNTTGATLSYAGYLGGSGYESGSSIAVDTAGNVYVTGPVTSTEATFPVLGGPDLTYNGGTYDAFVAKVSAAEPVTIPLAYVVTSGPTTGTINVAYTFTSTVSPITATQPITYVWQATGQSSVMHFGGLSDTVALTWNTSGYKAITVTASNVGSIVTDTRVITIYAPPNAEFTASPTSGFVPLMVAFTNTSSGEYVASLWAFGDGATSNLPSPTHVYTTVGVYTVTLTVEGPLGSDIETKVAYIAVWQCYKTFLPLVLRNP